MRKLCVRYKWLMLFLLISVVIVISYYASYNLPELFPGAGRLFDFAYQISIGYIINFIFFLLNVFHPQIEAENKSVLSYTNLYQLIHRSRDCNADSVCSYHHR